MKVGVLKEIHPGERRVAITPEVAGRLGKLGFSVVIEAGAGVQADYMDSDFQEAGAEVVADAATVWENAGLIASIHAPEGDEPDMMRPGMFLAGLIRPAQNEGLLRRLAEKQATVFAMDSIPRISRAQKLDALSSMANIAGYRAVIEAAGCFGRFFPGQITAAGKVAPAKVMVIGAGVAGLAAIGTAKSLGAVVRAFDTRPEVKEQIQSMDAEFLELDFAEDGSGHGGYAKVMSKEFIEAEMALFAAQAAEVDIIITTALIPGRPAPKLITAEMVKSMRKGSVIVDLAAEQGGNCECTTPHEVVRRHGVTIIGYTDLPGRLPAQSSQLYATNIYHLLSELSPQKNGELEVNMDDDVIRGTTVVHSGEITWPPPPVTVGAAPVKPTPAPALPAVEENRQPSAAGRFIVMLLAAAGLLGLGMVAPPAFMAHFTVFVLSCFVGYMVIWNVTPSLHTPLMSVTNAISSIIIVGALIQIGSDNRIIMILAAIAAFITSINIIGGFAVTRRMLKMFKG